MIEIHTGTKPGRPTVLLILSAVALVGALGLALVQVRAARALGPEQRMEGTPLVVRPPKGWIADPNRPGSFVLPVRVTSRGREKLEIDRRVRFSYRRLPTFEPPAEWLSGTLSGELGFEPARIGRLDAVQVRQVERLRWGRQIFERESIWRVAVLPAGHLITVWYRAMTDLTTADLKLLDRICDAVRIEQPTLSATPEEALQRAGVEFPLEGGWQVELPELPEVPGLYVGGSEDGFPAWSLGVFRTWLASGRKPPDLLHDFAATAWPLARDAIEVREWRRADGARVATVRQPALARAAHPVAAAWLVAESASEAVILFVFTSQRHVSGADEMAQRVVEQITIAPLDAMSPIDEAEAAGAAFAARLAREGLARWWGREPLDLHYDGTTLGGDEALQLRRLPIGGSPDRGYKGDATRTVRNKKRTEQTHWTTDGRGDTYEYDAETYRRERVRIVVHEHRLPRADVIHRKIELNDVEWWSGTFRPGPAFLCPPVESLAEAWAARQSEGALMVEAGTLLGTGTHSRLLRRLSVPDGHPRVLVQADYWPMGVVVAFDEDDRVVYEIGTRQPTPGAGLHRILTRRGFSRNGG